MRTKARVAFLRLPALVRSPSLNATIGPERRTFDFPDTYAVATISGIELAEQIKKGQFKTGKLGGCDATMTELWNAALAA